MTSSPHMDILPQRFKKGFILYIYSFTLRRHHNWHKERWFIRKYDYWKNKTSFKKGGRLEAVIPPGGPALDDSCPLAVLPLASRSLPQGSLRRRGKPLAQGASSPPTTATLLFRASLRSLSSGLTTVDSRINFFQRSVVITDNNLYTPRTRTSLARGLDRNWIILNPPPPLHPSPAIIGQRCSPHLPGRDRSDRAGSEGREAGTVRQKEES